MSITFTPGSNVLLEPNSNTSAEPNKKRAASCSDFGQVLLPEWCPVDKKYAVPIDHYPGEVSPNGYVVPSYGGTNNKLTCYWCIETPTPTPTPHATPTVTPTHARAASCSDFGEVLYAEWCPEGQYGKESVHNPGDVSPNGYVVPSYGGTPDNLTCYKCVATPTPTPTLTITPTFTPTPTLTPTLTPTPTPTPTPTLYEVTPTPTPHVTTTPTSPDVTPTPTGPDVTPTPTSGPVGATCADFGESDGIPDSCPQPCSTVSQSNHHAGDVAPNGAIVAGDPNATTPSLYCYKCNDGDGFADCESFNELSNSSDCTSGQTVVSTTHAPGAIAPDGCTVGVNAITCYKCISPATCADFQEYEDQNSCPQGCMTTEQSNHHAGDAAPNGNIVPGDLNATGPSLYCYKCVEVITSATCSDFGQSSSPGNCNPGQTSVTTTHQFGELAPGGGSCVSDPAGLTCYDCYSVSSISRFNNYFNNS